MSYTTRVRPRIMLIVDAKEDHFLDPRLKWYQFDFAEPILSAQKLAAKIKKLQKCNKRIDVVSALFESGKEMVIQPALLCLRASDRVFLSGLASYSHYYGAGAATVKKLKVKHAPIGVPMYKKYVEEGKTIRCGVPTLDVNAAVKSAAGNNNSTIVSEGYAYVHIGGGGFYQSGLKRIVDPYGISALAKSGKNLVYDEKKSTSQMATFSDDNGGFIHAPVYFVFRHFTPLEAARSSLNVVGLDIDENNIVRFHPAYVAKNLYIAGPW